MLHLVVSLWLPLLALNAVALILIYAVGYAGSRRWATWILRPFLILNAPPVLTLTVEIIRAAIAMQGRQGNERGLGLTMAVIFSAPLFLEFLLLLVAWARLRQITGAPRQPEEG